METERLRNYWTGTTQVYRNQQTHKLEKKSVNNVDIDIVLHNLPVVKHIGTAAEAPRTRVTTSVRTMDKITTTRIFNCDVTALIAGTLITVDPVLPAVACFRVRLLATELEEDPCSPGSTSPCRKASTSAACRHNFEDTIVKSSYVNTHFTKSLKPLYKRMPSIGNFSNCKDEK